MTENPQLALAYNFVQFTGDNVFLTGKAGTGKTTFLHNLRKSSLKRMAIVAPTGVAAINAGGVTIHSFFQIPFGPYVPKQGNTIPGRPAYQKFSSEKINLIRSIDLLVIDEISMVRADTLDAIDEVLRRYKNRAKPFGGIQLLMIGDLHQLSPVVRDEDWKILRPYYTNLYFFSSRALQSASLINIELKHIYRQTDDTFIGLLNHIRENRTGADILSQLNQRYLPDFVPGEDEGYITLTTHNSRANDINRQKLDLLGQRSYFFKADVKGDFPEYSYPADEELELKEGAQVMFIKNDPSREKLFYNGKIGRITEIGKEKIVVTCPGSTYPIEVIPAEWQNFKYELNSTTKEVDERTAGTFTQYPLKLAWAITIHKSQGLTFEKAIIDAGSSFAHGQVYVALSRCKSFEGMVLRSPIAISSVKTDGTIASYTRDAEENQPGDEQLFTARLEFQKSLVFDLFNFDGLKSRIYYFQKLAQDHENSLSKSLIDQADGFKVVAENEIYPVAETFKRQILQLLVENILPEDSAPLQERIKKACTWFTAVLYNKLFITARDLGIETDNKEVKKSLAEALENLRKEIFIKLSSMRLCESGFTVTEYLKVKANAEMDFQSLKKTSVPKSAVAPKEIPHPELYVALKAWRDALATEANLAVYRILPQKTLAELVTRLPSTFIELRRIKGIGKQKADQFGNEILALINSHKEKDGIIGNMLAEGSAATDKNVKTATKEASFELWKAGLTVPDIAKERGFAESTIYGHLSYYVSTGELGITALIAAEKVNRVIALLQKQPLPESPLNFLKAEMGDDYSFTELRMILVHYNYLSSLRE